MTAGVSFADDRSVVATAFHTKPGDVVMNLPPRPDVWPGAIFTASLKIPIVHGKADDPALHRGNPISVASSGGFDLGAEAGGGISQFIGVSAKATDIAEVAVSFPDARIVDMDYGDLIQHIQDSEDAIDAAKSGQIPLIVVKCYAGTPNITVVRKAGASAEAWAQLQKNISISGSVHVAGTDTISYSGGEEVVFAFETSQIQFDAAELNKGKYKIQLAALPTELFEYREAAAAGVSHTIAKLYFPQNEFETFEKKMATEAYSDLLKPAQKM
ncbi:hypothetical protein ACC688_29090 [Rhizobium ruizarguesonis]